MRWYIEEAKRKISTTDLEGHRDDIEMSGEQVSGIIGYGAENGVLKTDRFLIYPMFRTHPDVTQSSYKFGYNEVLVDLGNEMFEKASIDGVLTIYTKSGDLRITHRYYPSTVSSAFYEMIEIENLGKGDYVPRYEMIKRIKTDLCCKGYVYAEVMADKMPQAIKSGKTFKVTFAFTVRFANMPVVEIEADSLEKRYARVEKLRCECDLTTGDDLVDTMFAFAKVRAGESIFKTAKGRVHSPGGTNYYAAIWCNDQSEYSTPWFAFTGDEILYEAADNARDWFRAYMTDDYRPIPSSIISEATDFWNGAGDRGDASMFLYGNSRYFLTRGRMPCEGEMQMLDWCAEYIKRKITEDGVVFSDTDELENRISSGINLNTSSLTYGAFGYYAIILERLGKKEKAEEFLKLRQSIREGIENYFGANICEYKTYQYHKGCDVIRAWNCLPIYMGINERAEDTIKSIDEKLWCEGSLRSTEGEKIMWDRSALYYMAALFRAGKTEKAYEKLREYSAIRLLGDRVPYAVEAYPEYNMRHLSGESALFCRVITDGLAFIDFNKEGAVVKGNLPSSLNKIKIENIVLDGKVQNIEITK